MPEAYPYQIPQRYQEKTERECQQEQCNSKASDN